MTLEWVGTLAAATVGVAGITATYWAAAKARIAQTNNLQLTIAAENNRSRLAEKRRIYAAYMNAISSYVVAERGLAAAREEDLGADRIAALRSDLNRFMTGMFHALCEIRLIAPEALAVMAVNVVQQLTTSEDTSVMFPEFRDQLYELMRADLGEPEQQVIEVPELATQAIRR